MVAGKICQIGMCTLDLPKTMRIYSEVFGFAASGARVLWGEQIAQLQELPTGADTSLVMAWLVGRQDFVQLELFTHSVPPLRRREASWSPCDLGWVRFGIAVPDFEGALSRLRAAGLLTLTAPTNVRGLRRVCFREPGADVIVEIMEDGQSLPGGARLQYHGLPPAVVYVGVSVSDLERARQVFVGAFGLDEIAPDTIHEPIHERLWGLRAARRDCAVFRGGGVLLEVCRYHWPAPSSPAAGSLLSDQGIMNIAIGFRRKLDIISALDAAVAAGAALNGALPDTFGGVYLRLDDRLSLEAALIPSALDARCGFVPLASSGACAPHDSPVPPGDSN